MVPAILAAGGLLGSLFGGAAKGSANERQNQNQFGLAQDAMRNQQYSTQQQALLQLLGLQERGTMDRAQMGLNAPGQRTRQAILGSLLQNLQPAQIRGLPRGVTMPQMSGGLSAALLNPQARQAGGELQSQALRALISGSDVPAMPNYQQQGMMTPPALSAYRKGGKGESILSLLGLIGGGMGALGGSGLFGGQGGQTPPPYIPMGAG